MNKLTNGEEKAERKRLSSTKRQAEQTNVNKQCQRACARVWFRIWFAICAATLYFAMTSGLDKSVISSPLAALPSLDSESLMQAVLWWCGLVPIRTHFRLLQLFQCVTELAIPASANRTAAYLLKLQCNKCRKRSMVARLQDMHGYATTTLFQGPFCEISRV